jgi:hypothetical protein
MNERGKGVRQYDQARGCFVDVLLHSFISYHQDTGLTASEPFRLQVTHVGAANSAEILRFPGVANLYDFGRVGGLGVICG